MVRWPKITALALLVSGALSIGLLPDLQAATSATPDILSGERPGDASDTVDIGSVKPLARPNRDVSKPAPRGNPLWSVPLSMLSTTLERPVFSASRRPPPRAVVAPAAEQAVAPPPKPAEPERPALALIGAVVGDADAIAVLLDRSSQKIVRLRQGDSHAGWQLSSVQGREVTFKKGDQSEVLVLQRQDGPAASPAFAGGSNPPAPPPQPVAAGGPSYSPLTPRSTPKNGESEGL